MLEDGIMPKKGYKWSQERLDAWKETEAYQRICERFAGPKTVEQKRKMSEAKLGIEKTEQHRENMSRTHRRRWAKYNAIKAENPELESREIWDMVKEELSN